MRLVAAILGSAFAVNSAYARTVETQTPLDGFFLITEASRLERDEIPIMHTSQNWTKLKLQFVTYDEKMKLAIIDDGDALSIEVNGAGCSSRSWPMAYPDAGHVDSFWRGLRGTLGNLVNECDRLDLTQRVRYVAEWKENRPKFAAAIEALKKQAAITLGGWRRRCIKTERYYAPTPDWRCVRYSAKKN